jgi:hypothetical protein
MQIGFIYNDSNEHAWGAGIDNVEIAVNTTSIMELELGRDLIIYPNPNNGNFDIDLKLSELHEVRLIIRDMLGRTIWVEEFAPMDLQIKKRVNLPELTKGNYQLSVNSGTQKFSNILIIN